MTENTVLICDGGLYTAEYLYNNGIKPSMIILSMREFVQQLPYIFDEAEVMVLVHSCTDLSENNITNIVANLEEHGLKYEVFSNVDFENNVSFDYIYYSGEFFTSEKEFRTKDKNVKVKNINDCLQKYLQWDCDEPEIYMDKHIDVKKREPSVLEQHIIQYTTY